MGVQRLNHAVLYVTDAQRSSAFYQRALQMEVAADLGAAVFLRLPGNHHDLGLFSVGSGGPTRPAGRPGPGLYHLAWQVEDFGDLVERRTELLDMGALVGESDHGVSLSLYAQDPDGIEFEVMWALPTDAWGEFTDAAVTRRLDWVGAHERWA
ncbi:MAG: VOC family protein [Microthrixaceae bacterium]